MSELYGRLMTVEIGKMPIFTRVAHRRFLADAISNALGGGGGQILTVGCYLFVADIHKIRSVSPREIITMDTVATASKWGDPHWSPLLLARALWHSRDCPHHNAHIPMDTQEIKRLQ